MAQVRRHWVLIQNRIKREGVRRKVAYFKTIENLAMMENDVNVPE